MSDIKSESGRPAYIWKAAKAKGLIAKKHEGRPPCRYLANQYATGDPATPDTLQAQSPHRFWDINRSMNL